MDRDTLYSGASARPAVEINKVLRNTYMLLAMTIAFSAVTAFITMSMNVGFIAYIAMFIGAMVCLFITYKKADSAAGLFWVFAFTGLLGGALGPILSMYVSSGAGHIVGQALAATAIVFVSLSAYAVTTKKDFSFLRGFLVVGLVVVILAIIANIFFAMPALTMAINAVAIMIMSGFILFDTSRIVNGGETNYIIATAALYSNIWTMFIHMMSLLNLMDE